MNHLITTLIGFGMSAAFILFVCIRLICGHFRPMEPEETDSSVDHDSTEYRTNDLERVSIAAIPTMLFNSEAFSSTEDAQCTICLAEYKEKEVLRNMPKCGHSFHVSCIDTWLRKHSTCPVCRLSVQDDSVDTKHIPMHAMPAAQQYGSSETAVESSQWLLPAESNGGASMNTVNFVSIELDSGVSRAAALRLS